MSIACLMTMSTGVFAAEAGTSDNHTVDYVSGFSMQELTMDTVEAIEEELAAKDSSVTQELSNLIASLEAEMANAEEADTIDTYQDLIATASNLLSAYQQYEASLGGISVRGTTPATDIGIAAIVTWFESKGYFMASELLLHMQENTKLDSTYRPVRNLDYVRAHSEISNIRDGNKLSGSGGFSKSNGPVDLYYALHYFDWTKNSSTNVITISDRYDFEHSDQYSGLAGTAINFLYNAQVAGELLPYYVSITV